MKSTSKIFLLALGLLLYGAFPTLAQTAETKRKAYLEELVKLQDKPAYHR